MMTIPVFPGESDRQFSFFPPELSSEAQNAVFTYMQESKGRADPDILRRTNRVVGSLALFAGESLPPRAFDAAALMPLAEQLAHPNHSFRYRAASSGLHQYFTSNGTPLARSNGYVGTLLGDIPHLEESAGSYVSRLNDEQYTMLRGDNPIPPKAWINFTVGANIPEVARVHRKTNVESQLIKAFDAVDGILYAPDDDQELFDRVIRAESAYSVPLEAYGFHASDMSLQSTAGKTRVFKAGHEAILESTTKLLDRVKNISTEDIFYQYFGVRPKEHLFQTAKETLYDETIIYSSTPIEALSRGDSKGELHARFKTVGKYALKLLRNPNYSTEDSRRPSDLFGMLAVLPDEDQLAKFFTNTMAHVSRNDAITLETSASKNSPIYIKGSPEYVQRICSQLPSEVDRYIEKAIVTDKPRDHTYQVIKFTSTLSIGGEDIPIEFQFQTAEDRDNARLGKPAHLNHNAKRGDGIADVILGSPDELRTMYSRKHDIDPQGERVNPLSIIHGEEVRRRYLDSRRTNSR